MVHTYNGVLLIHQKNENFPFTAAWMDLEGIIQSGVCQEKKTKMISLICEIRKL